MASITTTPPTPDVPLLNSTGNILIAPSSPTNSPATPPSSNLNPILSSSPKQNADNVTAHDCRWDWCTRSFTALTDMREHVMQDHIAHAQPVRRGDVPILKRADGESVRLSWADWSAWTFSHRSSPKAMEKHAAVHIEKGVMTGNNKNNEISSHDTNALDVEQVQGPEQYDADMDAEGDLDPHDASIDSIITSEAVLFDDHPGGIPMALVGPSSPINDCAMEVPTRKHSPSPSPLESPSPVHPRFISHVQLGSRLQSPKVAVQAIQPFEPQPHSPLPRTQRSPSPLEHPSFAMLQGKLSPLPALPPPSPGTAALVMRTSKSQLHTTTTSPSPSPTPSVSDKDNNAIVESNDNGTEPMNISSLDDAEGSADTSGAAALIESQWHPQSQLSLGSSFECGTIDPIELQIPDSSGLPPMSSLLLSSSGPAIASLGQVMNPSDDSSAKQTASIASPQWERNDQVQSEVSQVGLQSQSQTELPSRSESEFAAGMPHSRGLDDEYSDSGNSAPLQTQAPLQEGYSWSSVA